MFFKSLGYNIIYVHGQAPPVILSFYRTTYSSCSQVNPRPVFWGLGLQFVMGVVILRTTWGYEAFRFVGSQARVFLDYTDAGAQFVFGKNFQDHLFAFKVRNNAKFTICLTKYSNKTTAVLFVLSSSYFRLCCDFISNHQIES